MTRNVLSPHKTKINMLHMDQSTCVSASQDTGKCDVYR